MDRPGRDPFDLVGEVENVLGIGVYPITWPVFTSGVFRGVYHRMLKSVFLFDSTRAKSSAHMGSEIADMVVAGIDDPALSESLGVAGHTRLKEEVELLEAAGDTFDEERFLRGEVSPMFFGSAINNFGLETFLDSFCEMMPSPGGRLAAEGRIEASDARFSAFVFKVQANMDRQHRDRVAFIRICSGKFERGMKVKRDKTGREVRLATPMNFMAQERVLVEEAYAGDVIGIHESGSFEIGDTISEGGDIHFEDIPSFAPEHFSRLLLVDPMRRKPFAKGIEQLAQEGTIQLYRAPGGRAGDVVVGAVGQLQLEVVRYRLRVEYDVEVRIDTVAYNCCRWVVRADGAPVDMDVLDRARIGLAVEDVKGRAVVLFASEWQMNAAMSEHPQYLFTETARGGAVKRD